MAGNVALRHYKTSDLISKFGRLAQTSQYYVLISPDSKRAVGAKTGTVPEKSFDFDRLFAGEDLGMLCNEASLPGNSFATSEMTTDFPGISQKFPYRKIYNDLQLTFYVDSSYNVIKFFESWMSYIASPFGYGKALYEESGQKASFRFSYPDQYKCNIFIAKFNKDQSLNNKIAYRFVNAFPIDITSMPVSYDASDILKCSVSFSYDRYIFDREGKLIAPTVGSINGTTANDERVTGAGGAAATGTTGSGSVTENQGIFGGSIGRDVLELRNMQEASRLRQAGLSDGLGQNRGGLPVQGPGF